MLMSMICIYPLICVDSMANGNDSNCFHISFIFFIEKLQNVETKSSGETTSPPPCSTSETTSSSGATSAPPAATSTLATSGQTESSSSASGSTSELSQEIPFTSFQTYEDTVHMIEATHFRDYNFYTEQDVEYQTFPPT